MWTRKNLVLIMATAMFADILLGTAAAQKAVPKPQNKLALGEDEVTQLVLLMDPDKNGKITKQEFLRFMEAEFDRLDKDKRGELDIKELRQTQSRSSRFVEARK
jgi:Ca2+-binding EF-hand superfamily protein